MSQEHSVDDIVKLLTESLNEDVPQQIKNSKNSQKASTLSEDELKRRLKQQYGEGKAEPRGEDPYAYDDSFLQEAMYHAEEEAETAVMEEPIETEIEIPVSEEITLVEETPRVEDDRTDIVQEALVQEDEDIFSEPAMNVLEELFSHNEEQEVIDELAPWESLEEETIAQIVEEKATEPIAYAETEDLTPLNEDIELVLRESEPLESDVLIKDEILTEEVAEDVFPEIKTVDITDLLCDYESEEAPTTEAFSFSESSDLLAELADEEGSEAYINTEQIRESVVDLMLQLGCEEEMETPLEAELSEDLRAEDLFMNVEEKESIRSEKAETIFRFFQKKKIWGLFALLGTAFMTLLIFLYDTLPLFDVEFLGMLSHLDYPGAYMMIGSQLLLVCALISGKPLWQGVKKMVTLHPNLYSVVALLTLCTFLYDLAMILLPHSDFPPMFHFLTSLTMLFAAIGEYALLIREAKIFSVYSTKEGECQYTLRESGGKNGIADQMYEGGLSREKMVYIPEETFCSVDSFASMREEVIGNRWISLAMLPSIFLSMLAMVITMILDSSFEVAAITAMTVLFVVLPLHAAFAICIPLCGSASRLQKRGIGVNGKKDMDRYQDGDLIVYNDLHLFRKCTASDTGIVFYDESETMTIMACLERLYSQIGGPLSEVFSEIPESCRFQKLRVRRIFRNGLEAFVEKKHILLVGDATFMRRYGLVFPKSEEKKGRSTLCISLDGKISAKMSVRYTVEPIFEMLVERLAKEGIEVVVETFDPLIQAPMIASVRTMGRSPINVFHKNVSYLYRKEHLKATPEETEIVATSSRLKLAEAVVWCKRLYSMRRQNNILTAIFSVVGITFVALAITFGWMFYINQYWLLLFSVLPHLSVLILSLNMMPKKNYFTVDACKADLEKIKRKNTKKMNKSKRKKKA